MKKPICLFTAAAAVVAGVIAARADDTPTMGWSSWNTYRVNISDSLIRRQADAMAALGLREAGYTYINIDDGYFGGRDESGRLLIHPGRFPDGLKPVADYIHSLGFKAGIYSDAGRNTCGNYYDNDTIACGVGLYGHDDDDARFFFIDNGFDFIKVDFCGGDAPQNSERLDLDERERYTAIRRAIDGTGREDVRLNICRWGFPGTWADSVGSSWRISHDINPSWESIKYIIEKNTPLSAYATGGHFNDMDMLEIGRGLSPAEERTHFAMWCMMSSPLLIGCDMTNIPEQSLRLITNRELTAINQDTLRLQAYPVRRDPSSGATLYVKDIKTLGGLRRAAAIYNPSDAPIIFTLSAADLDFTGGLEIFSIFDGSTMEIPEDLSSGLSVGPHDTQVFLVTGEGRRERRVYEAETAWLKRFQDIGYTGEAGYARYSGRPDCSAGYCVTWLGNHPDNILTWRDIVSAEGGEYKATLTYLSPDDRTIYVSVNDGEAMEIACPATEGTAEVTFNIALRPGTNSVTLSNSGDWAPDIDRIYIQPIH